MLKGPSLWWKKTNGDKLPIVQYCCVGIITAFLYFGLYYLIKYYFSVSPWIASALAFFPAIIFQYVGHAKFTYNRPMKDGTQVIRFFIVVISGLTISTLITGYVWPTLALPEIFSLFVVIILLPVVNFAIFTLWVFIAPSK